LFGVFDIGSSMKKLNLCLLFLMASLLAFPKISLSSVHSLLPTSTDLTDAPKADFFSQSSIIIWGGSSADEDENEINEMIATDVVAFRIDRWLHHPESVSDVLADTDIKAENLTSQNLILVGTPASNQVLNAILPYLPFSLDAQKLSLGGLSWEGDEVGITLRYPNPFNPAYQVLVISAPSYEALRYIPKPFDYCVYQLTDYNPMADRFMEIALGNFTASWSLDAVALVDNEEIDSGENDIPDYTPPASFPPPSWAKNGVMYEIFVRSFADSNNDGIGDLQGLISKLDYLNDGDPATTTDLGISVIWLMPIFDSPSYHGYDVRDYYHINPDYGTNEDFQELLRQAHARGIRIITDMVLNHASNQHPFFLDAYGNPQSDYDDWFFFTNVSNTRAHNWQFRHRPGDRAQLNPFMPAWNVNNPAVQKWLFTMCKYWIDPNGDGDFSDGIDGFRCDYVKGPPHSFWKKFRYEMKSLNPELLLLAEDWEGMSSIAQSFDDEFDMAFDFPFQGSVMELISSGNAAVLTRLLKEEQSLLPPQAMMNRFINNHDMNRIFTRLSEDEGKLSLALLLTMPDMPMLYYGDELGMRGKKDPYDEGIRRPMEWCADNASPQMTSWYPVWDASPDGISVEEETDDPASILSYTRALIALRRMHPAMETGDLTLIPTYISGDEGVEGSRHSLCYLLENGEETIVVVANLATAQKVLIGQENLPHPLQPLLGSGTLIPDGEYYTLACEAKKLYVFQYAN